MNKNTSSINKIEMSLDGLSIEFIFEHREVGELLKFLLADMRPEASGFGQIAACYHITKDPENWILSQQDSAFKVSQKNLNDLALPLLNVIMQTLSKKNTRSISLHAALVSDLSGSILMPGTPGSGKTNACLWLCHLGMHYHSDEFVTINREHMSLHALARPYTLRREALKRIASLLSLPVDDTSMPDTGILESTGNAWIDHRLINSDFQRDIPALKAIIFPVFTTGDRCQLLEISRARAGMELMRAHFQSQSFEDHGFATISALVRGLPVYLMVYNHFEQMAGLLDQVTDISIKS